jgi:hypothetical protein
MTNTQTYGDDPLGNESYWSNQTAQTIKSCGCHVAFDCDCDDPDAIAAYEAETARREALNLRLAGV